MKIWRTPIDQEHERPPVWQVHVIEDRCKGCGLCVEFCPRQVLRMSEAFNRKGYHPPLVIDADGCLGCRFCEELCPEFAIFCTETV
ncbi:MAG: 4Fe-4S binding protein [Thermodesulfobacteriota bacterium]